MNTSTEVYLRISKDDIRLASLLPQSDLIKYLSEGATLIAGDVSLAGVTSAVGKETSVLKNISAGVGKALTSFLKDSYGQQVEEMGLVNDSTRKDAIFETSAYDKMWMIEFLRDQLGAPVRFLDVVKVTYWKAGWFAIIPFLFFSVLCSIGLGWGSLQNVLLKSKYQANLSEQVVKADPQLLYSILLRYPQYNEKILNMVKAQGLDEDTRVFYEKYFKTLTSIGELVGVYWRKNVLGQTFGEASFREEMSRRGFEKDQQNIVMEMTNLIPPLQDLIHMMVRDAWNEDIVKKYGYDEDYPPEMDGWAEKQGYSKEWALRYWRAHWQLPSPQEASEMVHRFLITPDDMNTLLRINDYPKFWRDALIGITYNTIARVDIRRMYKTGVFGTLGSTEAKDEVQRRYQIAGYTEADAKALALFTIIDATGERKDKHITRILTLYKKHVYDVNEVKQTLSEIGLRGEVVEEMIEDADYTLEAEKIDKLLDMLKSQYFTHKLSAQEIQAELEKNGVHVSKMSDLLDTWNFEKKTAYRKPTMTDVLKWFKQGVVNTEEGAISMLIDLGYEKTIAENYVISAKLDMES